jgi:uncharacterized membrane protein (DUF485 family)
MGGLAAEGTQATIHDEMIKNMSIFSVRTNMIFLPFYRIAIVIIASWQSWLRHTRAISNVPLSAVQLAKAKLSIEFMLGMGRQFHNWLKHEFS